MGKDVESGVKILCTTNYDQFKMVNCNRQVKSRNIAMLRESIEKEDLLPYNPILVNENMEVLDGQTRLAVCKELGHEVYYIVKPSLTNTYNEYECVKDLNINQNSWDTYDYLNYWVNNQSAIYLEFKEFMQEHNLSVATAYVLFSNGKVGTREFRNGKLFKCSTNWDIVIPLIDSLEDGHKMIGSKLMSGLLQYLNCSKSKMTPKRMEVLKKRFAYALGQKYASDEAFYRLFSGKIPMMNL